tara:strand:+ start:88 stop:486 length:399 start_codon:yes stop_codon:yes gene_type:complete
MSTAKKTKPTLWKRIVSRIKSQASHGTAAGQWSGRKAQAAVKAYKKAGGGYRGGGKSKTSLAKWSKQKWRTKSGKKSSETGERYLPEKAIKNLSASEYARTTAKKRRDKAAGKQVSKQPKAIARKVRKYRRT